MANKNRIRISYPASEKIYVAGKIHDIRVGMRQPRHPGRYAPNQSSRHSYTRCQWRIGS